MGLMCSTPFGTVIKTYDEYPSRRARATGILQLVVGFAALFISNISLMTNLQISYNCVILNRCSIFYGIAGIIGLLSAKHRSYWSVRVYLMLSLFALGLALANLICSGKFIVINDMLRRGLMNDTLFKLNETGTRLVVMYADTDATALSLFNASTSVPPPTLDDYNTTRIYKYNTAITSRQPNDTTAEPPPYINRERDAGMLAAMFILSVGEIVAAMWASVMCFKVICKHWMSGARLEPDSQPSATGESLIPMQPMGWQQPQQPIINQTAWPIGNQPGYPQPMNMQAQQPMNMQAQQPMNMQPQQPMNIQPQQPMNIQTQQPMNIQPQQPMNIQPPQPMGYVQPTAPDFVEAPPSYDECVAAGKV